MPTVVQLPTGKALTVRAAADVFLGSLDNPNTVRNYGIGVGKTAEWIGQGRLLASIADDEIGEVLDLLWGRTTVNTPGTPAGLRCCPGSVGAASGDTRGRRSPPGRSGWRCRTPKLQSARRWRLIG